MSVKLLTEHHLEFLSLKGGCTGSSESTLVKMPHCWKSHVAAHLCSRSKPYIRAINGSAVINVASLYNIGNKTSGYCSCNYSLLCLVDRVAPSLLIFDKLCLLCFHLFQPSSIVA